MVDPRDDVEHDAGAGAGDVLIRHPVPAALAGLVTRISGYRETVRRPIRMRETASLVVPLVFSFGDPFAIAVGRDPGADDRLPSFTGGLTAGPVAIASGGAAHCLQVDLTPLGARRLFALPMHALTERLVRFDQLDDPMLDRLGARLGAEGSWRRRFALVESVLGPRLLGADGASPAVAWAYDRIVHAGGAVRVEALAARLEWSRKHLAARFHDEVGLPPKMIARIARFGRAQAMAASGTAAGWADVAAACGFADQAHLVREFVALGGASPGPWRERGRQLRSSPEGR